MGAVLVEGKELLGFKIDTVTEIPEIKSTLYELTHTKTGASVMHIANDDQENVFNLAFQTIPASSNGVAHILEHSVLCGSKKFPIRDPFFSMTRRSLNTFMNAMTGADFTCYPAASQVPSDFYNLLDVYLDAAFYPLLNKESFLQEGWRYEFEDPEDTSSKLQYGGIVYNEMKGALANPAQKLVEELNQALYPDITYGVNSGGNPREIPHLSYEEFCAFHEHHYHPSRAIFYFYGNMPLEGHLKFLNEHLLDHVEAMPKLGPLPRQPRFKTPVVKEADYSIAYDEDPKDKTFVAVGWLTCHVLEQKDTLALSVIEEILMSNDVSPLKKALLKSGLCHQASSHIEGDVSEVPFVVTAQGSNPEDGEKLQALILETLKQVARDGIPEKLLDSALHQIEIERSEISGDGAPYGLSLFFRSALFKQHSGKAEYGLMIHSLFNELRAAIAKNPRYLEDLIEKYLIQNPHRVLLIFKPSKTLAKEEREQEREALDQVQKSLSQDEKEAIKQQSARLMELQLAGQKESLDVLPKTNLEDVPKETRDFVLKEENHSAVRVYHHDCFTNGMIYADAVYKLPSVPAAYLPYVRLFALLLPQVGCGGRTYEENLEYIERHTGGVAAAINFNNLVVDYTQFTPTFHIKGKALNRKAGILFEILRDIVVSLDFSDTDRIKEVVMKHITTLDTFFVQHAIKYAIGLGASGQNISSYLSNEWFGLSHYQFMKALSENIDSELPRIVERLEWMKTHLLGLEGPDLVLTCDESHYQDMAAHQFYGFLESPRKSFEPWKGDYSVPGVGSQGRMIASQVAFSCKVLPTLPYAHPDSAALTLASHIFDNMVLHPRIREQGGAYGSGASHNPSRGFFYFYAFRDPNIASSFAAFEEAVDLVRVKAFNEERLDEAKRETLQSLDHPIPPGSRGIVAYHWLLEGKSKQARQSFRDRVLSLTREEVHRAVTEHLFPLFETAGVDVVFAGKDLLTNENKVLQEQGKVPFDIISV